MSAPEKITSLFSRIWRHIGPRRRKHFFLLLILTWIGSIAEIVGIGAVIPFLSVLASPSRVFYLPIMQPIIQAFNLTSPEQLLLPVTIGLSVSAIFAGAMRLLILSGSNRLSLAAGAELSSDIYRRTLYRPYTFHVSRNSAEIINIITSKTTTITGTISSVVTLISCSIILGSVLIALVSIDPVVALTTFGGFALIYVLVIRATGGRLQANGQILARESTKVIKSLQEGLGGIRDVIIGGGQETHCRAYRQALTLTNQAQASNLFISQSPRYIIEPLGMTLIACVAYFMAHKESDIAGAIPVLGALAMGAQRLLPLLQQAYGAWTSIRIGQASLQDALELLEEPLPEYAGMPSSQGLPYRENIFLENISFRYAPESPWVLQNLNLVIPRGARVGFMGVTGSGKSTLLDIIMGLLKPTSGTVIIDKTPVTYENHRAWQAHIAHVPQAIYLADITIEENIAFGVPLADIDHDRVRAAARQAQLIDTIEAWPLRYKTVVGERGVRLSGGQRQRIGIARALYKHADVIVLDEATSALDTGTEHAVMEAIDELSHDLTILIIAHRLTTLKNCSMIVELGGGSVLCTGTYHETIAHRQ